MTSDKTLIGREYLRVSADRTGRMASPAEQHNANAADAEREQITLGEPYAEERDVSASMYSNKVRDAFVALLADLEADRFGADLLYLWESSRGSRKVGEWVDLLDLCAKREVLIRVTTHGRTYDPRNGRDRRTLLEDAVDSEYESYKTSTRIRRTAAEMAADGRPYGKCPTGYVPVHDSRTGKLLAWEPDPHYGPLVAELFERIAAGHTFRSIAADFAERGVVNRSGRPFGQAHLRRMALRPVYAGLRRYQGTITSGLWEPLVPPALFWTVQRILTDPARRTNRAGRAMHELTMIMRCGVCVGPMAASVNPRGDAVYRCRDHGHVTILREPVDGLVIGAMLGYLARDDVYAELNAGGDGPELEKVRGELAAARVELANTEEAVPETVEEARLFAKMITKRRTEIAELEERERELTTPAALRRLIEPGADVRQRWDAAPISTRREIARVLLSPELLGQVRVHREPTQGLHVDVTERVEWWHGPDGKVVRPS